MNVEVERTELSDVLMVRYEVFRDHRGSFREAFRRDVFVNAGLPGDFVQLNHSTSHSGVIRGLHLQWSPPMAKVMRVVRGRAFLVAVDVRPGSETLGKWVGRELTAESDVAMWAPASFARGFCTLDEPTDVEYLCTATYRREGESEILWSDPEIGIEWPVSDPVISERDQNAPPLRDWLDTRAARAIAISEGYQPPEE